MLNLLISLVGIFALIVIVGRLLHRYFLYVPDPRRIAPKDTGVSGVEEVVFKATDGTHLVAWYLPAQNGKPTLLYLTGNSGNAAYRAGKIAAIGADGYGVFLLNYRGYGGSEGQPTEERIMGDAVGAYDCLRGLGVAPHDIVAYGESLGTAVATRLVSQREVKALMLEAPLMSAVDVGRLMWPGFPLELIMVDKFRTMDWIGAVDVPTLIVHGGRDEVIPLEHARRIHLAAKAPKTLCILESASHNDLFEHGAWAGMRDFLAKLDTPQPVAPAGGHVELTAAADAER